MKLVRNAGPERVIDIIRPWIASSRQLDLMTFSFSLFALAEVLGEISKLSKTRLLLPSRDSDLALFGTTADRGARNRLQARWRRAWPSGFRDLSEACWYLPRWYVADTNEYTDVCGGIPTGGLGRRRTEDAA
jgi:hypothetical protein